MCRSYQVAQGVNAKTEKHPCGRRMRPSLITFPYGFANFCVCWANSFYLQRQHLQIPSINGARQIVRKTVGPRMACWLITELKRCCFLQADGESLIFFASQLKNKSRYVKTTNRVQRNVILISGEKASASHIRGFVTGKQLERRASRKWAFLPENWRKKWWVNVFGALLVLPTLPQNLLIECSNKSKQFFW